MCDEEVILAASIATILFLNTLLVQRLKKGSRRYRIRLSQLARRKYSMTEFMRDII